ncbi:hypothetical protein GUJ93_ZPchr0008g12475 [Zizania palustris]|uniref:Uncharacterized protein n=1 Tax=Zizania palustris TaxID=103762 RepID=A0A8J5R029_ZIZPA|nr:hypothetical protein GUJ93_ZPchr0008g12475 [Zizania palustris]
MLAWKLTEDIYSDVEVHVTPMHSEIIIHAMWTWNVLREKDRMVKKLTSIVRMRFNVPENGVKLYTKKVFNCGLYAIAQAKSLCYNLLGGLAIRRYNLHESLLLFVYMDYAFV